jgi:hypothetical protein
MGLLNNTSEGQYYAENNYGNYQFTSLDTIINQFQIAYVGQDKLIPRIKRADIQFHAMRAMQELSFDTFKSFKSREVVVPNTLQMILPQDYVNYTKISWVDSSGIKNTLHPTSRTSNPYKPQKYADGDLIFDGDNNTISTGELLINGDFLGSEEYWDLNKTSATGVNQSTTQAAGSAADPITNSVGWFFDSNKIIGYNLAQYQSFRQLNVPIRNGEKYTITYTLSGYSSGQYKMTIVDERGDYTNTTVRSADGTYTETITAGSNEDPNNSYPSQSIFFRNTSSTVGNVTIDNISIIRYENDDSSTTWKNYKSSTPSENQKQDHEDDKYWPLDGGRYGIDPQHAQVNGSFYMDQQTGKIHFSSNVSGKTVVLDYISDGLGTDEEMQVHKFAEEAMYKHMVCGIMSSRANVGRNQLAYYKKEKFAAIRNAKLRLSNIKLEELTQILRGKSKQIKH